MKGGDDNVTSSDLGSRLKIALTQVRKALLESRVRTSNPNTPVGPVGFIGRDYGLNLSSQVHQLQRVRLLGNHEG